MLKMEIFRKKIYARARNKKSWMMVNKQMINFKDCKKYYFDCHIHSCLGLALAPEPTAQRRVEG